MRKISSLLIIAIALLGNGCASWEAFKKDSNNGFESTKKSVNKLFE